MERPSERRKVSRAPRFRRRPMPPPKTTMAAALLFVGGILLLTIGLSLKWHKDHERGRSLIILGCLSASRARALALSRAERAPASSRAPRAREDASKGRKTDASHAHAYPLIVFAPARAAFLPGSYASWNLYGAYKGWVGYDYSHIPSYDD